MWFALMVVGWATFFALLLISPATLEDAWRSVREASIDTQGAAWLLLFPFMLATGVWESSWPLLVRLTLVCACAAAWLVAFYPSRPSGETITQPQRGRSLE